jgi:hypothetical protein
LDQKRDVVTEDCRKLHTEELRNVYSFPNIIRHIKPRGMRWAGACDTHGEERKVYKVFVERPKEREHSEDRSVDGRMGSWRDWLAW